MWTLTASCSDEGNLKGRGLKFKRNEGSGCFEIAHCPLFAAFCKCLSKKTEKNCEIKELSSASSYFLLTYFVWGKDERKNSSQRYYRTVKYE